MFKMETQSKKAVKCLVSYVLCIYATDLSVTEVLVSSQFASVIHKDSG